MKKIAIINQRYGKEVNGGSEYYTMQLAEHLCEQYEVEILTTQALSYTTWENHYSAGTEEINGITVRRFPVKHPRQKLMQKIIGKLITVFKMNYRLLNGLWIKAQGPYAPELVRFIEEHETEYDVFVFVTYLYYPAVYGMEKVKKKSVFVPTAHEEAYIHFRLMQDVFTSPSAYVFLTEEEKNLVHSLFPVDKIPYEVSAMGIEPRRQQTESDFREKYEIHKPYLIYAGRIDVDKGCGQMLEYFEKYCCEDEGYMLVLIGKSEMEIPQSNHIRYLGFVSEEDKDAAIAGAKALCLPSKHESLSIAALEAMYLGTPVIVNGYSDVLKGHCTRSGGGMSYTNYEEFRTALRTVGDAEKYAEMSDRAVRYVEENYQWKHVLEAWGRIFDKVAAGSNKEEEQRLAADLELRYPKRNVMKKDAK